MQRNSTAEGFAYTGAHRFSIHIGLGRRDNGAAAVWSVRQPTEVDVEPRCRSRPALAAQGWRVRGLTRDAARAQRREPGAKSDRTRASYLERR